MKETDFIASWPLKEPKNSPEGDTADAQRFKRLDPTLAIALAPFITRHASALDYNIKCHNVNAHKKDTEVMTGRHMLKAF